MNLSVWKRSDSVNGGLARLRDEMERTFDRFLSEPLGFGGFEPKMLRAEEWAPPLDLSETDKEITIRAEVPGVAGKDLDISVTGNVLQISGQKEESSETKNENYYQCERRFGSFRRVIDLPETADSDRITAESDNGLVTIHIAKKPGVKPKRVEVKPTTSKRVAVG